MRVEEKQDLRILAAAVTIIPIIWIFILGWSSGQAIMGSDALLAFPRLTELLNQGGQWQNLIYRADILGGIIVADVWGKLPIYHVLGAVGVSSQAAGVIAVWLLQILFTFIGVRATIDFLELTKGQRPQLGVEVLFGLVLLQGFWPALGGRLAFGHLDLMLGLLTFCSMSGLILASRLNRWTVVHSVIVFFALTHAILSHGQQMNLYSFVFGLPIWMALIFFKNEKFKFSLKSLSLIILFFLGTLFFVLPQFIGMLHFATSSDAARAVGGENLIYSFSTATRQDWLASIPWTYNLIHVSRDVFLLHDIVYPLGPLLIFLFLAPWLGLRAVAIGGAVSGGLAILFSMNIDPVASLLPFIVPPLKSFRSPARAILPIISFMIVLFGALAIEQLAKEKKSRKIYITIFIATFSFFFLPAVVREVILWLAAIIFAAKLMGRLRLNTIKVNLWVLFFILSIGSVFSFKSWYKDFLNPTAELAQMKKLGQQLSDKNLDLKNPLYRVQVNFMQPTFNLHTGMAMGLSTISGYWPPTSRFSHLYAAISNSKVDSSSIFFNIDSRQPGFEILRQLYNIRFEITNNNNAIQMTPPYATLGPAWFVRKLEFVSDYKALANKLNMAGVALIDILSEKGFLMSGDEQVMSAQLPSLVSSSCSLAQVSMANNIQSRQEFVFKIESAEDCPLVIAMNFSERLRAKTESGFAKIFPVNGALTGVLVPAHTKSLQVLAEPDEPLWTWVAAIIGLVFICGAAAWNIRLSKPK